MVFCYFINLERGNRELATCNVPYNHITYDMTNICISPNAVFVLDKDKRKLKNIDDFDM